MHVARRRRGNGSGTSLGLCEAAALGALHGPAELLPVSSSGHLVLVPALLRWAYVDLDAELRKSFEVALHAGTAAALLIALRHEAADVVRNLDGRRLTRHALTFLPPALAAFLFERPIEQRLGSPQGVALAQIVGGTGLAVADRARAERGRDDARSRDAIWLGVAQATALAPGVSRNGATLTAARALRFERPSANVLSRHAALPIILAAATLKGVRLTRRGLAPELRASFATGAVAAFLSTLAASPLVALVDDARSYLPFALYRIGLGAGALRMLSKRG